MIVELSRIPMTLAGGLSADYVAQAIAAVRPWGSIRSPIRTFRGSVERRILGVYARLSRRRCADLPP
jgi:hypothetical protein